MTSKELNEFRLAFCDLGGDIIDWDKFNDALSTEISMHNRRKYDQLEKIQEKMVDTPSHLNKWNLLATIFPELANEIQSITKYYFCRKEHYS